MAAPKVDQAYLRAAASAREQLSTLIQQDKLVGPALIRLAFNDSLTYDKASNTCGANGSIRTAKELAQPGNEGLKGAVDHIKGVKAKFPTLSHADLIQLAAVAAVAAAGGPEVQLALGRADSWGYPPPGRLPHPVSSDDPVAHLRALASRLGLGGRQLVALAGAHPLCGRWWPGTAVPEDGLPRFSNGYFRYVLLGRTDAWLLEDAELSAVVAEFAADEEAFAKEYALAHEELSRLGTKLPPQAQGGACAQPASSLGLLAESSWAQAAVAVAGVAMGVVIAAGVYWRIRRRRRLGF